MSCQLHETAQAEGTCADCGQEFCIDCEIVIKRHGSLCITCGAAFAKKKIIQSYIAIGLGLVVGFFMAEEMAMEVGSIGFIAPLIYAYLFFAIFWGWHYGGKIWLQAFKGLDSIFSGIPLAGALILISIRFFFAAIIGTLGGGILQFIRCREIVSRYNELIEATAPSAI